MIRALVAVVLLLGLSAEPAGAAAKPRTVVRNAAWFAVDGSRYAAWGKEAARSFTVLDTRTHRRHRVAFGSDCSGADNDRAMLGGWLLVYCGQDREELLNVRTGRSVGLPSGALFGAWFYVGKRYVEGSSSSGTATVYFDRRRRTIRTFAYRSDAPIRDLDDPKLRPLCRGSAYSYLYNATRFYDARYVAGTRSGLVVRRRCHGKKRVLSRASEIGGPFLAGGRVSWSVGRRGYIETLRSGKRRGWRIPHYRPDIGEFQTGQTHNTAFFAPPQADDGFSAAVITRWDVYAVGL